MTISSYSSLKLFKWPHLSYQCEVFNMFTHLISQAGLSRIERGEGGKKADRSLYGQGDRGGS